MSERNGFFFHVTLSSHGIAGRWRDGSPRTSDAARGGRSARARSARARKERRGVAPHTLDVDVPPGSLLPRAQTRATPRRRGRRRSDGRGPSWGRLICARRSRDAARGLPRSWNPARGARGCARTARRTSITSLAFWLGEASDARVNAEARARRTGYPHGVPTRTNDDAPTGSSHSKSERFRWMRSRFDDLSRAFGESRFLYAPNGTVVSGVFFQLTSRLSKPPVEIRITPFARLGSERV